MTVRERYPRLGRTGQTGFRSWHQLEEGQVPSNGNGEWVDGIYFSQSQLKVLRAAADPRLICTKQIANNAGLSRGGVRQCLDGIYKRLNWKYPSIRLLSLYAMAHAAELGIEHDWRNGYERGPSHSNKRNEVVE